MARAKRILAAVAHVALVAVASLGSSACATPTAPGMIMVTSSAGASGPGSMLVAFPATACTGTDSAVFIDEHGGFVAAVAPGTATYLEFPSESAKLFVVSSRDVVAPRGTRFQRHMVERPGQRVEQGIVIGVPRIDAKNCYRSAAPIPAVVTYEEATQASKNQQWLDVRPGEPRAGTLWLDEHRARVDELVDRAPAAPAPAAASVTRAP